MVRVLDLENVFELVNDGFNDSVFARQGLVHQLMLEVRFFVATEFHCSIVIVFASLVQTIDKSHRRRKIIQVDCRLGVPGNVCFSLIQSLSH